MRGEADVSARFKQFVQIDFLEQGLEKAPKNVSLYWARANVELQLNRPDEAEKVNVAMATIDPERDTDEVITGYVQSFIPGAHGLRTDIPEDLREAADVFGADYGVSVDDEGTREVFHTAHLYAIDDRGLLQVTWPFGTEPESLATDIGLLLEAE